MLLLFVVVILMSVASSVSRARRRAAEERAEQARRADDFGDEADPFGGMSPFGMLPFGGLLEALMGGVGARSFRYDEETGQWVEITDEVPEPGPEPQSEREPTAADEAPRRGKRRSSRPRQANTSPLGPLGAMMGGLGGMGGGSGNFQVESPDELSTFDDVGGMETLKQEVQNTVGLMLEHPDDAERYGIEWNGILLHGPPGVGRRSSRARSQASTA